MQLRIENFVKVFLSLCAALVLWGMWASAQTNSAAAPEIEFGQARYEVAENAGSGAVVVRRRGDTNAAISANIVTIGGTATASDYTAPPATVTLAAGKAEEKVTIPIRDNAESQETRTIKLALSNPVGARLGGQTTTEVLIVDDDAVKRAWVTFGLHRVPSLNRIVAGVALWQYLATLIYALIALLIAKFFDIAARNRIKKWAERTRGRFDDLFVELLRAPFRMIIFVILLHVGLSLFEWPAVFERFVSRGLTILVALSLTYAAIRVIDLFIGYWKQRVGDHDRVFVEQLLPIIRNTAKVFAVIIGLLLTLSNLGVNITSLITSLGIGGLALALAAQDTLANFFGAIVIVLDRPFRIGDHIQLPGADGTVEAVGFRSTRVRAADGNLIYIPNKTIGNATITNVARASSTRAVINLAMPYTIPTQKLRRAAQVVEEIFKAVPRTKEWTVAVNQFGDSAVNLQAIHVWDGNDPKAHSAVLHELNLAIRKRFEEEAIEFAFPSRTVYLKQDGTPNSRPT